MKSNKTHTHKRRRDSEREIFTRESKSESESGWTNVRGKKRNAHTHSTNVNRLKCMHCVNLPLLLRELTLPFIEICKFVQSSSAGQTHSTCIFTCVKIIIIWKEKRTRSRKETRAMPNGAFAFMLLFFFIIQTSSSSLFLYFVLLLHLRSNVSKSSNEQLLKRAATFYNACECGHSDSVFFKW